MPNWNANYPGSLSMSTDQLIENLHQSNDQRLGKMQELIGRIDKEMTLMIKVIACAATAPHRLIGVGYIGADACVPTCPTCIAKRFLTNTLTPADLELLKVGK